MSITAIDKVKYVAEFYPQVMNSVLVTKHGLMPETILAMGAMESGWGKSRIGKANIFGVKASKNDTNKILAKTFEYFSSDTHRNDFPEVISVTFDSSLNKYKYVVKDWFADYSSAAEAFDSHYKLLLNSRYSPALKYKSDTKSYIKDVISRGYATADPEIYSNAIASLAREIKNMKTSDGKENLLDYLYRNSSPTGAINLVIICPIIIILLIVGFFWKGLSIL